MTEHPPAESVLAYEMLELRHKMMEWLEEMENLGLIGKWVPGLAEKARVLRGDMVYFMSAMEIVIVEGYGLSEDTVHRMMDEIDPPDQEEDEE